MKVSSVACGNLVVFGEYCCGNVVFPPSATCPLDYPLDTGHGGYHGHVFDDCSTVQYLKFSTTLAHCLVSLAGPAASLLHSGAVINLAIHSV